MRKSLWLAASLLAISGTAGALPAFAQEGFYDGSGPYTGSGSVGSNEPLFRYDDLERWKHGYLMDMPYYGGFHSFRPYNYTHVFSQSSAAQGWGMSPVLPYSQQFWHRYEAMTDLSNGDHTPLQPYIPPPQEWDHYPKPYRPGTWMTPTPAQRMHPYDAPGYGAPNGYDPTRGPVSPAPNVVPASAAIYGPASR